MKLRLPWRRHVHIVARARRPASPETLIDAIADAAHELDEEVFCVGGYHDESWGIYGAEVLGFRMSRDAATALHERVRRVVADAQHRVSETMVSMRPRCRCHPGEGR